MSPSLALPGFTKEAGFLSMQDGWSELSIRTSPWLQCGGQMEVGKAQRQEKQVGGSSNGANEWCEPEPLWHPGDREWGRQTYEMFFGGMDRVMGNQMGCGLERERGLG